MLQSEVSALSGALKQVSVVAVFDYTNVRICGSDLKQSCRELFKLSNHIKHAPIGFLELKI
jgi:hypothetical protein